MHRGHRIDYKALREVAASTSRLAVLEYLKTNDHNISDAARVFGINRSVVYDILKKEAEGDLQNRSRVPRRQPTGLRPRSKRK
jgi:transposase